MIELITHDSQIVLLDKQDHSTVKGHKWTVIKTPRAYAVTNECGLLYMHRLLLNAPSGWVVDHVNGNTLDNRRKNLRICSQSQNLFNSGGWKYHVKREGIQFKGVWRIDPKRSTGRLGGKLYEARISVNGKQRYLGMFKSAEEAAHAYDEQARLWHGEYARLNFPDPHGF